MANAKLFDKVKECILRRPDVFAMEHWCNSTACIAGTAVIASIGVTKARDLLDKSTADFTELATRLLDLKYPEDDRLFYLEQWPIEFAKPYIELEQQRDNAEFDLRCSGTLSPRDKERLKLKITKLHAKVAQLAVKRIDHFLQTGE